MSPRPITLTPPPLRLPSPGSIMSSESFLSSHHSDDDILSQGGSPPWFRRSLTPSLEQVQEEVSTTTSGPYLSTTSSSSLPPLPPPSITPSSPSSTATVRPRVMLDNLQDLLDRMRDQLAALWDGQLSTNHMLDELRGRTPVGPDNAEMLARLRAIEDLLQQVLNRSQPLRPAPSESSRETESSSDPFSDLERLRQRLRDFPAQREQPAPAQPMQPGISLDEELAAMLRAPIPAREIERPPVLIPFVYQPAPRTSRPRSASPTLPIRASSVPLEAPVNLFDGPPRRRRLAFDERPRRTGRRPDSEISYAPVIPGVRFAPGEPGRVRDEQRLQDAGRVPRTDVPPVVPVLVSDHISFNSQSFSV